MRYFPRRGQLKKLRHSSVFRLFLIYMLLFSTSVLILLGFIYWATIAYMSEQTDARIDAEISNLAEEYQFRGLRGLARSIQDRITHNPQGGGIYLFARKDYSPLTGNLREWPPVAQDAQGWLTFRINRGQGQSILARARSFPLKNGHLHLLVGRDIEQLENTKRLIRGALVSGLLITLALALLGGITMSWSTVRRIEIINHASRQIMNGDLSRRIKTQGSHDDFDQLAENLNAMLDQIEVLMAGVRQVSDNIAHDLKTPLTRLRQRLEDMLEKSAGQPALYELVEANIAEADQLLATFNALLRIARIEAGGERQSHKVLELAPLLNDAVELYEALAQDKEQTLTLSVGATPRIRGDRDLLFQVLANLLDNAIKYTPPHGRIALYLEQRRQQAVIRICDSGPGIPEAAREKVLRRFFRLEHSRNTPGNGLGLSLVAAVAQQHHGELILRDNPQESQGLEIQLEFPLYPQQENDHSDRD